MAGAFNNRNPAYVLSRVAIPTLPEDPKFLPLICTSSRERVNCELFCHYRRIGIAEVKGAQLFLYPSVEADHRSSSFWLITELLAALTSKNDPWVQKRTRLLFDGAFAELAELWGQKRVQLLDVACGSARVTMGLCRKAFARFGTSFNMTLVDLLRGAASIATAFHRNPRIFRSVVFRHESFYEWIDKNAANESARFDLVLMLRICDVFGSFQIQELSHREASALIRREKGDSCLDIDVTSPAKLIEQNKIEKLHHRLWRSRYKGGMIFHQFSLSDYFLGIKALSGEEVSGDEKVICAPLRRFDQNSLLLPSGGSLIGQLMKMADKILVEDSDLTAVRLRRHLEDFGLGDLTVTDLSYRRGGRGASVVLVGKRQLSRSSILGTMASTAAEMT